MGSSHTMKSGFNAMARAIPIPLPLATGEFVWVAAGVHRVEADDVEETFHPGLSL